MDENLLLTAETLLLSPDLQKVRSHRGWIVLKNIPTQTYLRVSDKQWEILRMFTTPRTVPNCLETSIQDRSCIPLREFYELMIKAHRAFVLRSPRAMPTSRQACHWPLVIPVLPVLLAGVLSMAAAISLIFFSTPSGLTNQWSHWLAGWMVWAAALSLGNVLAASVIRRMDGDVYRPRFLWQRLVPHFSMDLSDARMQPVWVKAAVLLAKYPPLAAATAVALRKDMGAALPLLVGFCFALRPLGGGMPGQLFELLHRKPQMDATHDFTFSLNRRPAVYWKSWWRGIDWRLLGLELAYAAGWTVAVVWSVLGVIGVSFREMLADWNYWAQSLPWIGAAVVLMLVYIFARQLYDVSLEKIRRMSRRFLLSWTRWRGEVKFPETEAGLLKLVGASPLLSQLNIYDQAVIARALRPMQFKAWQTLVAFGQSPEKVGLILSGRAVVSTRLKSGRRSRLVTLAEGNLFGAHAMVDKAHPSLEVSSRSPMAAMMIPSPVFQTIIVDKLGATQVYDLTHKLAFLQRLPLCAHWYGHALGRFARLSKVIDFKEGTLIVAERSDARAFFIVYEGLAVVSRRGKKLGALKAGDYFGEIGILQNSSAVAEVSALTDMRCLEIGKTEFLRFVAHNHHVALELEHISSRRLGRPIFPMVPHSFDER